MILRVIFVLQLVTFSSYAGATEALLKDLIEAAYAENPSIKALKQKILATQESAEAVSTLKDPMIGISELNRGNKTRYWTIGQKLELPQKYSLKEDIQESKSKAQNQALEQLKLDIRAEIVTTYYGIYAVQNIKKLTRDDLGKIKEFSRIAETKYAAGTAPMQDSMKAHFAQTQVESNLISLNQEEDMLQARMRAILNKPSEFLVQTKSKDLIVPKISSTELNRLTVEKQKSPRIKQKQYEIEEADQKHSLAKWQYAPDFQFKYQGRLSGEPEDTHIVSLEMSVPLWFWGKSAGEKSASMMKQSKKYELENVTQNLSSMIDALKSKVKNQSELLEIFKTSLIPQARTSYEASVDAYKANKVKFLSLLDSERSLLKVQIAFYRTLIGYIEAITKLESALGYSVSDLGK